MVFGVKFVPKNEVIYSRISVARISLMPLVFARHIEVILVQVGKVILILE
jgi:hypothetical protein